MNAILMLMLAADPAAHAERDIVLLDFTASYCQPCQQMVPILQRMEKDGYPIQKIDITEKSELSRSFRVDRIPTLVLLVEGKEVRRFVGLTAEDELRREMRIARDQLMESREASDGELSGSHAEAVLTAATATRSAQPAAGARTGPRSLRDVFRGMLQPDSRSGFEFPTVRAQDAQPGSPGGGSLQNASGATVRIQVTSKKLQDVGTGTIIYSVPGQSLILTCAHLFVGQDEGAQIGVDVFQNGEASRFPAKIVGGDHNADLAVIRIQNAAVLPFVSVTAAPAAVQTSQAAVSFGCDNGRVPTPLQTQVLKINQYNGPSNLTCSKDPVQGRSGGGLFDADGHLLAVCSCADRENKEGLYMSQPAILDLMKKLSLDYAIDPTSGGMGEDPAEAFAAAQAESENQLMAQESLPPETDYDHPVAPAGGMAGTAASDMHAASAAQPGSSFESSTSGSAPAVNTGAEFGEQFDAFAMSDGSEVAPAAVPTNPMPQTAAVSAAAQLTATPAVGTSDPGQRTRVTVLIDSGRPGGSQRMIVIPQATPWLLELLTGESATQTAGLQNSLIQTTSDRRITQ